MIVAQDDPSHILFHSLDFNDSKIRLHILFRDQLASAIIASVTAPSHAQAETISLLCGFETVIVNLDAKSVRVQEASLEKQTREYKRREFRDGYKHTFFGAQVQDYVSVTEAAISYGHDDGQRQRRSLSD